MRRGFTLIEILIVIVIIILVTVIALPVVLPALNRRQISEAARILQGALAGARDSAIATSEPAGVRLLPDPAFPISYLANGQIDPTQPLAFNRMVPLAQAPEYSEGMVTWVDPANTGTLTNPVLVLEETVAYVDSQGHPALNEPTAWFWNVRVGDKLQLGGAGIWYTVVGPLSIDATGGNSELYVNAGEPGTTSPWMDTQAGQKVRPEFLFLVNGLDDNKNGWTDEGWDGVDNDNDGTIDNPGLPVAKTNPSGEWEQESWPALVTQQKPVNAPYTIRRRPSPAQNSREIALPTNVVIDATTWGDHDALGHATPERSRLPINLYSGTVDVMVNPSGSAEYNLPYSVPSAVGMASSFFHFWLADRKDVVPLSVTATAAPYLPVGDIHPAPIGTTPVLYGGSRLQGEYAIVTLFGRTGKVLATENPQFDNPSQPLNQFEGLTTTIGSTVYTAPIAYQTGYPFKAIVQGSAR